VYYTRAELKELVIPTKYDQFMEPKAAKDWKKAEKNCTLGYTGNLKWTQERQAKEGHDREASRAEAQTFWVLTYSGLCIGQSVSAETIHRF